MRIGIVTQWPFPNSSDNRCRKIVETLAVAGHDVFVFTAVPTDKTFVTGSQTIEVNGPCRSGPLASVQPLTSATPFPGNPYWAVWLQRQARRLRLDWFMSKELRLGLSTCWAARASRSKFWIDLSENYPGMVRIERGEQFLMPAYVAVAALLERRCARSADLVTVVTESNRERLAQHGVSKTHLVVVSNTPVLQTMATRNGNALREKLNLVYAGVLSKVRGLDRLLMALGRIGPERERIRLHIAGEGSEEQPLRTLTKSLGLTNCVQFHGWVPREELPSLFAGCDVGVIPHVLTEFTQTTIPNKLFDYMACGMPVWTTSMRPCQEIIECAKCGWVSEDTVDGMAVVLRHLLSTSEGERHAKGERGRHAVHSSYNWNVDSRRMLDALAS